MSEIKGNGNVKGIKRSLSCSEDEEFLGFDTAEQNDSQHVIQNIKKICTDSSSDEMTVKRQALNRTTDILDPAFKLPFKYGWKRELVLRAEPTMSKEKGEVYYITPTGKKLRTRHEIQGHLHDDLTINNFTLVKEAIGAAPDDEIIRLAKYYNYARRSNVDPVISESPQAPLGKRTPKPKLPKGASPPPPTTPTISNAQNLSIGFPSPFSPSGSSKNVSKETFQESKPTPARKPVASKAKSKGDARCTIQCLAALGKIPQLQCKHCLCLYHHECAKFNANLDASTFVCENCNFKQFPNQSPTNNPPQNQLKKHHQPPLSKHNFESQPQALITYMKNGSGNGMKFIIFESDDSSNDAKKIVNRLPTPKANEVDSKPFQNRQQDQASAISPLNYPVNYFRNASAGFNILLHVFQYLKVQELQRASRVCRMWNSVANSSILWKTVRMKNSHVFSYKGFVRTLKRNETIHLDLRKVLMGNQEEAWREFSEQIGELDQLQGIDLCRCTSNIVENLFASNPKLRTINAAALKDEKINLEGLNQREVGLEELRLRSVHSNGLTVYNMDFLALMNVRHLSLTTVENLHTLLNDNVLLGNMTALESLELGSCEQLNDQQLADNLSKLTNLTRLRIEKGSQNFGINVILNTIATSLPHLTQLELINCDVKNNFIESISECKQLKRLLLIPTYVSQSAATNFMIMQGVMTLTNLDYIHWFVTNELLRVTELYLDQSDNRGSDKGKKSPDKHGALSPVKPRDCIPILKPVPGKEGEEEKETEDIANATKQQQVEIVALKIVESILSSKLTNTKVKLLKIPHANTWRQSLEI